MNAKKPNLGCKHSEIPIWKSPDVKQQRTHYPLAGTPTLSKAAFGAAATNVSKVRIADNRAAILRLSSIIPSSVLSEESGLMWGGRPPSVSG